MTCLNCDTNPDPDARRVHPANECPWRIASSGVDLIAAERRRQIDAEGWTPEHDAEHQGNALALAAECYLVYGAQPQQPALWPWRSQDWKPTPDDRVRQLVKAGALIAAEIDRLQAAS